MEKLVVLDQLTAHGAVAVETGVLMADSVAGLECVAEVAECLANLSKGVTGASTVFHLVKLTSRIVLMCAEGNPGQWVPPVVLDQIVILLCYVLKSMIQIVMPSPSVNEAHETFVLAVLEKFVHMRDMAERELLRGWFGHLVNSKDEKMLKENLVELVRDVVIARDEAEIVRLS